MAKRLSYEEKTDQAVVDLINEMFKIAGHDGTYDDVKDRKDDWFNEWTMTTVQQEEWQKWGKKYFMKKFNMLATRAEKEMNWASLMWSLKLSDFGKKE